MNSKKHWHDLETKNKAEQAKIKATCDLIVLTAGILILIVATLLTAYIEGYK
jgi:CHASE3 domain sensor protein